MDHRVCIVCPHVLNAERPVRVVIHHHDGVWQAVCGHNDHASDCADFETVGLHHLIDRQPDLNEVKALPPSHIAEQSDDIWRAAPFDENAAD